VNIRDKLTVYQQRGFSRQKAAVNALLEEALRILFAEYPETFVFFGGASLVLFYESSRHSGDLDLLLIIESLPLPADVIEKIRGPLQEPAQLLGFAGVDISTVFATTSHFKLAVKAGADLLFTIDATRISAVIRSELVEVLLPGPNGVQVKGKILSRDFLLFQKAESFLLRRYLKVRDAFDIKFLLDSGAKLTDNLRIHLTDGQASECLENPDCIHDRIAKVNAQRCALELEDYLPAPIYGGLADKDFEPLRSGLRNLFSPWLEEA
jgi:hypothetical protein